MLRVYDENELEKLAKDMSQENLRTLEYIPPLRDGQSVSYTYTNYDERRGYNQALEDIKKISKEYKEPDYISIFSIPAGKEFINFDISGFPNKFVDKKATIKIYLEE